ncbi:cytochrome c oxidase assembly protein [Tomitella fengzijianii]|uniref:Cytochrome c oxidase assembly protein n=1 Tax=Tomitella fengzijianii TaxID=2597660 RepID=A0A516X0V4_9ACTN|nr:cytochrome c oxidase assembly protein [Tomitella fengzijianii]QDQ96693.1 cytochrome c oxidase assembly protein [Tomitella fengzijianii]
MAAVLLAAATVGPATHVLLTSDPDHRGRIRGRPAAEALPRYASLAWVAVAVVAAATVDASDGAGPRVAWAASALAAGTAAGFAWWARAWQTRFAGVAAGCAGAALPATVGTLTHGADHDRTGVFGLIIAVTLPVLLGAAAHLARRDSTAAATRRHLHLSWVCLAALAYSVVGIVVITMRGSWASAWGALSAVSLGALAVAVAATAAAHRRPRQRHCGHHRPDRVLIAGQAGALLVLAVSTTMMMHVDRPAPDDPLSVQQLMVGFDVPGEWTWARLVTDWRVDVLFGPLVVAMAVFYLMAVRRLHVRGDTWPVARTVSWLSGCLGVAVITCTGVNRYAYGQFTVHMILHMGLSLFIPALLAMGGAVTLAMRALPARRRRPQALGAGESPNTGTDAPDALAGARSLPGPREWIMLLVHARSTRMLCNPLVAITIYIVTLYGLYFSGIFDWAIRAPWGHEWMTVHFLITGYLFYWPIIGIDPGPKRLPHVGRLGVLFAIMPFHAFFGIAVMSMSGALGQSFYRALGVLGPDAIDHQQTVAGGIAWVSGELPLLVVFLSLATQWARSDRRTASRHDRQIDRYGDDELDAYNAMLKELQDQRR